MIYVIKQPLISPSQNISLIKMELALTPRVGLREEGRWQTPGCRVAGAVPDTKLSTNSGVQIPTM